MDFSVKFLGDASKNCTVWVRGRADVEDEPTVPTVLFSLDDIASSARGERPRTIQLASALWTLQEKLGLRIWTSPEHRPENLLLIMESRNFIRLERDISLDNWSGKLYMEPFNITEPKWFWFQLDFDKAFSR